ncbi:hypothetical protein GCM10009754_30590 [Amycolatopsis minnesotensis]|uniref:TetR family transcriptional regulator n=1 Tax=Amycolatopsis minnesotensis TaxID=337894 RepID=A0ABN2QU92_9PSEU
MLYHFESKSALMEAVVTEVCTSAGPALVTALGEFAEVDTRTLAVVLRPTIDALPGLFESDPTVRGPELAEHLVRLFDRTVRKEGR